MKKLLMAMVAAATATCSIPASAGMHTYDMVVSRVIDGDTVVVEAPWLLPELGDTISIRILDIDTPEKGARAKCEKEAKLGEIATRFAQDTLPPGTVVQVIAESLQWDKFGGRINADIFIGDESFAQMQIDRGYARQYDGRAKQSWCN